jgi:hypothetical protein
MTDACILCNHEGCKTCSLNAEYKNEWSPNETTAALLGDLMLPNEMIDEVTYRTMEARCQRR